MFCSIKEATLWFMLGTCELKKFNTIYSLSLVIDSWVYIGYGEYRITRSQNGTWIWLDSSTNTTKAYLDPDTKYDYPIGRKNWRLLDPVCGQESGLKTLLLTVCDSTQFSCDDGTCINRTLRCDLKYDCQDNTDEINCHLIRFPKDYKVREIRNTYGLC